MRVSLLLLGLLLSSACASSAKSQVQRDLECEQYRLQVNVEAKRAGTTPYAFINCKDGGASRYDPSVR